MKNSNPLYETSRWTHLAEEQMTKTRIERMYQYPASVKQALMHKKANQFGYNCKTDRDGKRVPLCPCCQLPINTLRIFMNYGTTPSINNVKDGKNVFLLNAGSAMFFSFIKMVVVYLLMRFLLSDCYNLVTNILSTNCDMPENIQICKDNIVARYSSYNKGTLNDEPFLYVVDILNLVTIVLSIIFFLYYRRQQYHIYTIANISNISQSDYSIFVEEIPFFLPYDPKADSNSCLYEDQLKHLFQKEAREWVKNIILAEKFQSELEESFYKLIKEKPSIETEPVVTSVSLCFDLTEMEKLNSIRTRLMDLHKEDVENGVEGNTQQTSYIPNQINCVNEEYMELSKKFSLDSTMAFNLSHFVGKAFVSFQYVHYKSYFLEYFKGTDSLKLSRRILRLSPASQPSDVYWFNMRISEKERFIYKIQSALIMFMTLCFSFALLLGLQYWQISNTSPANPNQSLGQIVVSYLFTLTMTVLTTIINYLLAMVCQKLTEREKHQTKTDYVFSLMTKSIISQFINTAFIYYMIGVVADLTHSQNASVLSENGIVIKVSSLVAVSGGIQIVLNAVQVGNLYNDLLHKLNIKEETVNMFQIELNQLLQDPQFDFANRYTYYIVNIFIVSFFSYITPYATIILALIFIIQYWVDKYNLFRRFSCPIDFDFRLSRMTLRTFEISVLVFAVGNYIFSLKIHHTKDEIEYHTLNLVSLLLSISYVLAMYLLPKSWFVKIDRQIYQTPSYSECLAQKRFNKVYWLSNPATSFAKEPYINDLSKFVDYGQTEKFAQELDYDNVMKDEEEKVNKIEKYGKDVNLGADILMSLQADIGSQISEQTPQGQPGGAARKMVNSSIR